MRKKITISIDQAVYDGLRRTMGYRRISELIEELLRPLVTIPDHFLAMDALSKSEPSTRTETLIQLGTAFWSKSVRGSD